MYEYIKSLYSTWAQHRTPQQQQAELDDFIRLANDLLHSDPRDTLRILTELGVNNNNNVN